MKATAFNGSPRVHGNTRRALELVLDELKPAGIETEIVQVGGLDLHGCISCFKCSQIRDRRCHGWDDAMNPLIEKMYASDIIIIGSPTYFASMSTETKALIDRAGLVEGNNGNPLRRKIGAAVVAVRRGGATAVFSQINSFFLMKEMVVPGSTYWNFGFGSKQGDILKDEEGVETFKNLGRNIAWLAERLKV
ncbi:MAG: flavodoxin family protein [bacterium]